jgi:hypothetical protein
MDKISGRMKELDSEEDEEFEDDEDDEDFPDEDGEDDYEDDFGGGSGPGIPRMTEKRVEIGSDVCAIGIYNEMRRGLLPAARGRQPNRLFRGSADKMVKVFRGKVYSHLVGGLVFLALAHLATLGVMQVFLHSDATARDRARAVFEAVDKGDLARLAGLARRGMDLDIRNDQGIPLMEAKSPRSQPLTRGRRCQRRRRKRRNGLDAGRPRWPI